MRLTKNSQLYTIDNLHQLPESLKVEKLAIREGKDHISFIQKQHPLVTFTYPILPLRDNPSVVVNNVSKTVKPTYSMTIMSSTIAAEMKCLRAKIAGFSKEVLKQKVPQIALTGIEQMFIQNPNLKEYLCKKGSKILVEAAPRV